MRTDELILLRKLGEVPEPDESVLERARERAFDRVAIAGPEVRARRVRTRRAVISLAAAAAIAAVVAGLVTAADSGHPKVTQPVAGSSRISARLMSALDSVSGDVLVVTSQASAAAGTNTSKLDPGDRLDLCDWTQWLSPAVPRTGDTIRFWWHYVCGDGQVQDVAVTMKSVQVIPATSPSDSNLGNSFHGTGTVSCTSSQPGGPEEAFTGDLPSPPTPPSMIGGRPIHVINPGPGVTIGLRNSSVSSITSEVSAGDFRLVGPTTIQGRPALELRYVDRLPGTKISSTVWIDPETYLPIQQTQHFGNSSISNVTYTFDFVPATAANLAHLNLSPPSTAQPAQPSPAFCSVAYLPANLYPPVPSAAK